MYNTVNIKYHIITTVIDNNYLLNFELYYLYVFYFVNNGHCDTEVAINTKYVCK